MLPPIVPRAGGVTQYNANRIAEGVSQRDGLAKTVSRHKAIKIAWRNRRIALIKRGVNQAAFPTKAVMLLWHTTASLGRPPTVFLQGFSVVLIKYILIGHGVARRAF